MNSKFREMLSASLVVLSSTPVIAATDATGANGATDATDATDATRYQTAFASDLNLDNCSISLSL
jgi:hypothetical protein